MDMVKWFVGCWLGSKYSDHGSIAEVVRLTIRPDHTFERVHTCENGRIVVFQGVWECGEDKLISLKPPLPPDADQGDEYDRNMAEWWVYPQLRCISSTRAELFHYLENE